MEETPEQLTGHHRRRPGAHHPPTPLIILKLSFQNPDRKDKTKCPFSSLAVTKHGDRHDKHSPVSVEYNRTTHTHVRQHFHLISNVQCGSWVPSGQSWATWQCGHIPLVGVPNFSGGLVVWRLRSNTYECKPNIPGPPEIDYPKMEKSHSGCPQTCQFPTFGRAGALAPQLLPWLVLPESPPIYVHYFF